MRLPRDVSAARLIKVLEKLGYQVVRQKGSHIRMRHLGSPAHAITIPAHSAVKAGTLHGILAEVARMRGMTVEAIVEIIS